MPAISHSLNPRIKMFVPEFDRALAPLLLTRIEGWDIFHADVLPMGWPLYAYSTLAQSHASFIGLDIFLIVDERTVMPIDRGEVAHVVAGILIGGGKLVAGHLSPPVELQAEEDLARHRTLLESCPRPRAMVPDPWQGGARATRDDIAALDGLEWNGVPRGLEPCEACGEYRGRCLVGPPRKRARVEVRCGCDAPSVCAGCGERFHARRLGTNHYDPETGEVRYVPGVVALRHTCLSAR